MDAANLSSCVTLQSKGIRHLTDAYKGLTSLLNAPVIGERLDIGVVRYRNYGERGYVGNLYALLDELLASWRNLFLVHVDAIFWDRAILVSHFRYEDGYSYVYWNRQVR